MPCLLSVTARDGSCQLTILRIEVITERLVSAGQDWLISCHDSILLQLMEVVTQTILGVRTMKHERRRKCWRVHALAAKRRQERN